MFTNSQVREGFQQFLSLFDRLKMLFDKGFARTLARRASDPEKLLA